MKILGLSGSLRNARHGMGSQKLISEIEHISSKEELFKYLEEQTKIRADEFVAAGREQGLPFDEIYKNLQKAKGLKGLSNSEATLVAGLWGAMREGVNVEHTGLSKYFPMGGSHAHLDELKSIILSADALLISGPVYFGDRSSLIQELVEFISSDEQLKAHLKGKVYAGISVGAKRNGGQETQLIYQLIDMLNLNMLGVGNSAETTSQYGGTVVAGDVGTAWKDDYGLDTSIGTGQRLARIALSKEKAANYELKNPPIIDIWLVQDSDTKKGLNYIKNLVQNVDSTAVKFNIRDLTEEKVARCIACDVCPTHHASREEYTCIIKTKGDVFVEQHEKMMQADAVLLAAYSPVDRKNTKSVYQKFIERSRYIRRGSYMLSDRLTAPFIITELNANQNLHIRMLTSLVRHHTILHHPLIGVENQGELINESHLLNQFSNFVKESLTMTTARLAQDIKNINSDYSPIGYHISQEKNQEDIREGTLVNLNAQKAQSFIKEQSKRISTKTKQAVSQ